MGASCYHTVNLIVLISKVIFLVGDVVAGYYVKECVDLYVKHIHAAFKFCTALSFIVQIPYYCFYDQSL